ncbi:outer membrane surface antigen [Rhizobium azibense]|uniref:Outer membrane surface antigen n=1 Tax=Rhizobium azibense TaxID=1136135 RepID=A0A4R3R041_9HYPH|nr:RT0821/Lpp0805 family surface protein [Rhizobium azibense]TCU27831.1 outer membrane surface antigen [Rhizobium azibense]TCU37382.1 outer membrane surface antigen [Rhizobium azibense]
MEVIAKSNRHTKGLLCRCATLFAIGATMLPLSGCMTGGFDFLSDSKVDRSVATGTVPQTPPSTDTLSDEMTVRNAVTSADIQRMAGQPLPWANSSTGSAGVIDTIVENNDQGQVCRQFRTTRHSYAGIAKFYGKTCLVGGGNWQLLSFQPEG